jgi:hypothetical protein
MNVCLRQRFHRSDNFPNAFLILTCVFIILFANGIASARLLGSTRISTERPLRVLFIGNSYTYFNNLPRLLEQVSRSAGKPIETKMVVEGGATLQDQWGKGDALKVIREGPWDFVIMQDQSTLGAFVVNGHSEVADPEYFQRYARMFDQEIRKVGAKTIFYLTWARKGAPARDQAALNYAYISIAQELNGSVAPVGIVWQEIKREDPNLELYIKDNSHPTGVGSYAAACVLYSTIYGTSPIGLIGHISGNPVDDDGNVDNTKETILVDLSPSDAELIQRTAWETYTKMRASGGYPSAPKPPPPVLPSIPSGLKPTAKDLDGVWVGLLNFYPVPWPATMELRLRQEDGGWKVDLKIKFEGHPDSDKAPEITNFKITGTEISFLDEKGVSGAPMKYTATFTGDSLVGIVEARVEDKPIAAIGKWELRRQN